MKKTTLFSLFLLPLQLWAQYYVPWTGGDDGAAIQAALNNNSFVALQAGKVYQSSVFLNVPGGVTFDGNDATLKPHANLPITNKPFINTSSVTTHSASSLSIAVAKGSTTFSYGGAANIKAGQIVELSGPMYSMYPDAAHGYSYGWYGLVTAVSGSTVTMANASSKTYTANAIKVYTPASNVHIKNMNMDMRGRTTGYGYAFTNAANSSMEYVSVRCDSNTTEGISVGILPRGVNLTIDHADVRNIRPLASGTGVSYGIDVEGTNILVSFPYVRNAETCITSAGRTFLSTDIKYLNVDVDNVQGAGHALDFHGNASGWMKGGVVVAGVAGSGPIAIRQSDALVQNIYIKVPNPTGITKRAVYLFENAEYNIDILNNRMDFYGSGGTCIAVANKSDAIGPTRDLNISGNIFLGGCLSFPGPMGVGVSVSRNWFETYSGYPVFINISTSVLKDYAIEHNVFVNRTLNNVFNYCLSTPAASASQGSVKYDTVYIMDETNTYTQFRFNNNTNVVQNNVIYTPNGKFITDYSTNSSLNTISNNTVIIGTGTPGPIPTDITSSTGENPVPVPDTTYVDPGTVTKVKGNGNGKGQGKGGH